MNTFKQMCDNTQETMPYGIVLRLWSNGGAFREVNCPCCDAKLSVHIDNNNDVSLEHHLAGDGDLDFFEEARTDNSDLMSSTSSMDASVALSEEDLKDRQDLKINLEADGAEEIAETPPVAKPEPSDIVMPDGNFDLDLDLDADISIDLDEKISFGNISEESKQDDLTASDVLLSGADDFDLDLSADDIESIDVDSLDPPVSKEKTVDDDFFADLDLPELPAHREVAKPRLPENRPSKVASKISHSDDLDLDLGDVDFDNLDLDEHIGIDQELVGNVSPALSSHEEGEEPTVQVDIDEGFLSDLELPELNGDDDNGAKKSDDVLIRKEYKSSLKAKKKMAEVDPDDNKLIHNVFLSKIKDSTLRGFVIKKMIDLLETTEEEAMQLCAKVVIPIAKGVTKPRAQYLIDAFKEIGVMGRITKKR